MKRVIHISLLLSFFFSLMAQASTYDFLVFTSTEGTTIGFTVTNLALRVDGSNLQVTNDEQTVHFALTNLASMQFTNENPTAFLENVLNADTPLEVYSITGASIGTYGSLLDAAQQLNTGTYVISNGSVTQTIIVK